MDASHHVAGWLSFLSAQRGLASQLLCVSIQNHLYASEQALHSLASKPSHLLLYFSLEIGC
jgi:hypothetical protein